MPRVISDEDYNAQATFYFPAGFRNETQYVAFWDTVAIPDSALEKLLSEQVPPHHRITIMTLEIRRSTREKAARIVSDAARLAPFDAEIRKLEEELAKPEAGGPDDLLTQVVARPVARATGLATYIPPELDTNTRDRILDHEFDLGDGRSLSARVIVARFRTLELDFLRP